MAEGGYIKGADIIDVEDVQRTFRQIESDMEKLGKALKSTAQGLDIKLLGATDSDSINGLTGAIQSVADAMKKWKSANDVHREAMRQLNDEIKNQIGIAKAAAEEESIRTQQMKTATEEERKRLIEEKKCTEVAKQQAEADKARAKAQSDLAVAQARVATEQAKQQAIQQRANQTRTQNNQSISQQSLLIQQLVDEIEQYGVVTRNTLDSMNLQTISYRELAEAAKVMGARLKEMSAEEKATGKVGADMVRVTKAINEELARQDANVARYSRNVGNYRSAFDGLGYSIQQVLREVPSAINVSQFFLAISNNIPMVVDQMKMFRQEQSDIKEQLEDLTEGTKEYMELQKKQMSLGTKFLKAIFSWQTAIIAVLFLLRKYGEDLVNWFVGPFKKVDINGYLKGTRAAVGELNKLASDGFIQSTQELTVIVDKLKTVKQGTDDWVQSIKKVNEICNSNLSTISATPDEVRKVTEAYIEQAKQIAKNNAIIQMMEESNKKMASRMLARKAKDQYQLLASLGVSEDSEEGKKLKDLWHNYFELNKKRKKIEGESIQTYYKIESGEEIPYTRQQYYGEAKGNESKAYRALHDYINKITSGVLSNEAVDELMKQYDPLFVSSSKKSGSSKSDTAFEEMNDRYFEAWEARISMMEDGWQKEEQMADMNRMKSIEQTNKYYEELETAALNNLTNRYISQKEYEDQIAKLDKQKKDEMLKIEADHEKEMLLISETYYEKRVKDQEETDSIMIASITAVAQADQISLKRRQKTVEDERIKNEQLTHNINVYREALEKLNSVEISTTKGREEQIEQINKLTEAIKKLQAQIDHSKALDGYSSLGDMLQRKGVFEAGGGTKRNILENILGKDAYAAYTEGSKELESAIDADYDKWLKATQDAVKTWYNTTIGYISDLISAYVQLSEAKVEAAESDTEAAKEAYEKEKALMEAGYASRIDAAWDEYQEKQKIQKQAEKDAKKAQEVQTAIDTATQASSMITAIANLYKAMSGGGAIGIAAATVLSGTMVAAFTASKIAAYNAAHTNYGEGGFEMVEQGGSHASGNDTELGVRNRHGRRMVVERNEGIGVFSTRGMRMYGRNRAEEFVKAFNSGTLDAESGVVQRLGAVNIHQGVVRTSVNLKRLEQGVAEIAKQGENTTYVDGNGNTIVKTGNTTKIYVK